MSSIVQGPDLVLACPHCDAEARLRTFEVGEFDAVAWTDGYREIEGLPRQPDIGRCHACAKLYWVEQAMPLGEIVPGVDLQPGHATWPDAPLIAPLDEADYYDAIDAGLAVDSDHELTIRLFAWWRSNDRVRRTKDGVGRFPTDERAIKNLERLVELCAGGDHEILLFRVEGLRELGRFDEAAEALQNMCSDYAPARERLERLIARRSRDLDLLVE